MLTIPIDRSQFASWLNDAARDIEPLCDGVICSTCPVALFLAWSSPVDRGYTWFVTNKGVASIFSKQFGKSLVKFDLPSWFADFIRRFDFHSRERTWSEARKALSNTP